MKKVGTVPTGKSGAGGHIGKSTPKLGSALSSGGKLPSVPSTSPKNVVSSSYQPSRNNKSSTFGIIWLPGKRRNKHKELVYNSHKNERSGDRAPSMYNFMSGDSSSQQTHLKKKEEESDLLVPQHSGHIPVTVAGAGVAVASELPSDIMSTNSEERQEFIKSDKEDAAGDANDNDKKLDKDYLENNDMDKRSSNTKTEKDKLGDNVDSVFLRSPPPHKTRSTASTVEEEDCGIKCLYYTLQCCDCVLM
ncbi:uncharacterized protein LOC113404200 isoform X2 [Vanessa tameamea]|nr:uncharacterized protein LOC113404200 isoform X1 [Vanessa tameamea]